MNPLGLLTVNETARELNAFARRLLRDVKRRHETANEFEAAGDLRTAESRRHFADGISHVADMLDARAYRLSCKGSKKR